MSTITERLETFMNTLESCLIASIAANPHCYNYGLERLHEVLPRYRELLIEDENAYRLDGPAVKATCKTLGISCTYPAIRKYLQGE